MPTAWPAASPGIIIIIIMILCSAAAYLKKELVMPKGKFQPSKLSSSATQHS